MNKVKLGNIGKVITGCTPSTKKREYYDKKDYMFVGPSDIKNVMYVEQAEKGISEKAYEDYAKRFINKNSIVVDCIGSDMGNVAIVTKKCLTNQQINAISDIDESKYNIKYVFYVLSTMKDFFHLIGTNGSTMPILNKTVFENIEIELPDIETQNKVAKVLSKLDDKIKLNNEINNILLNQNMALYNEWCVNFNFEYNGKKYRESNGEMYNTEYGEVPKNWTFKRIDELDLDISDGNYSSKYPTKQEFKESGIPFIRGTDFVGHSISSKNLMYITPEKHEILKKGHLKKNDILITTRGEIGHVAFVSDDFIDANINAQLIRINGGKEFPRSFLGMSLISDYVQNDIQSLVTGTALQQLPVGRFNQIKLLIPDDLKIIEKFDKFAENNLRKIQSNESENEKLESIRNLLLPRLLSGKISLDNIEE